MRYLIIARPRAWVAALAVAGALSLALAGGASAETYKVSTTAQLVEAVSKANANAGANTIVLASGVYLPEATLSFTNTSGVQTVEGAASSPGAKLEGSAVVPSGAELFVIKAGVSVTFKKVLESTGGSGGVPAIDDAGSITIESSTVGGNNGPAIHVESGATATVKNSTISDGSDFGVIDNGTASFFNSTVAFNKIGGIENRGTLNLTNTIVAKNAGSGDCVGAANTSDHSLDSDGSCGVGLLSKTDPLLGKLANNGGPTPTRALLLGSAAIDAGDTAMCPTTDQRGFKRPDVAATACDVGAYEFQAEPHWYEDHVPLAAQSGGPGEEGTDVLMWGKVTLSSTAVGMAECETAWGGDVYNPEGSGTNVKAGQMKIDAFRAYDCTSTVCEATDLSKLSIEPEGLETTGTGALEWEAKLAPGSPVRLKMGNKTPASPTQIKWHVVCPKTTGGESNSKYVGELEPELEQGTGIGSAPTKLMFNKGELEEGSEKATVGNKVRIMGFEGADLISTKSP